MEIIVMVKKRLERNGSQTRRRVVLVNLAWSIDTTSQQISAVSLKTRRMISWLTGKRAREVGNPQREGTIARR